MRRRRTPILLALLVLCGNAGTTLADTRTAQIGPGFVATIRCDGPRMTVQRTGARAARVHCRAGSSASPVLPAGQIGGAVDLVRGDELRVLCDGARLRTQRMGSQLRAFCRPIPAPQI